MRNNETGGIGDQSPKKTRGEKPQIPQSGRREGQSEIAEKRIDESMDYPRVARTFLEKDANRLRFFREGEDTTPSDSEVLEHMSGLKEVDDKLKRASSGSRVYIQYQDKNLDYVTIVGKTDGKGLSLSIDPETNEQQLTFGTDAVIQKTVRDEDGQYRSTLTERKSLIIPEGASLRVVTRGERFRSFQIGDDEIKRQVNISGEMNAAWYAFMLEQAGVDTDTFFDEFFNATARFSERRQREIENDIRSKITDSRKAYDPDAPDVPLIEIEDEDEAEEIPMQVSPITIDEGRLLIEDAPGSYVDLGGKVDQMVAGSELAVNAFLDGLRDHAQEAHYVSWEGNNVPRGASIKGREIADTRHGLVIDPEGDIIGSYVRLDQSERDAGRQEMIVFTFRDTPQE